jgi:hypothetical protein
MFSFFYLYILIYKTTLVIIMEQQNVEQQVTRGLGAFQSTEQRTYPFPTETISLPSNGLVYPETNP